jgi:hypothetical protein
MLAVSCAVTAQRADKWAVPLNGTAQMFAARVKRKTEEMQQHANLFKLCSIALNLRD